MKFFAENEIGLPLSRAGGNHHGRPAGKRRAGTDRYFRRTDEKEAWKNGPINRWLADNCFGDYYTRTGLDLAQRELITLCFPCGAGRM